MSDDALNMSMRKFLKQVGVTSQQQIEAAVRAAGPKGKVTVRAVISCPEIGLDHVIEGDIDTGTGGEGA
ncbi:DUF6494 family protein [Paralimibaculum aggregatum]|uniref:DUF6494 family protein n=1 Tax=Paralimibaculum aggregatum TaxID=3036245 RepID=A0ABQ6LLY8_9RHOB|nr:DUF6494 family protein [Limibaculum sp. NKW23]GMG84229.1 DUF6494 family protein [Limibaculum sp. NKW23]